MRNGEEELNAFGKGAGQMCNRCASDLGRGNAPPHTEKEAMLKQVEEQERVIWDITLEKGDTDIDRKAAGRRKVAMSRLSV